MSLESANHHQPASRQVTTNTQLPALIETMRAEPTGEITLLGGHLTRLETSARALGFQWPGRASLLASINGALERAPDRSAPTRFRLLLRQTGEVRVETAALAALRGTPLVALATHVLHSDEPLLQHKTTHRPWYEATTNWLSTRPEFFDLVFMNERGELCEGSRSNLYIKKDGQWVTPPVACGLLGGVMRQQLLQTGQVREGLLYRTDFEQPKAQLRLSNGLRDWFDVQRATSFFPGRDFP